MHAIIDPIPLSFLTSLTVWALAFSLLLIFRTPRTYAGFSLWVQSAFCLGAGGVLIGLRGLIPAFFSLVVSNLVAVVGLILIKRGLGRFFDRALPLWPDLGLLLLIFCTQMIFTYLHPNLTLRSLFISVAHAAILLHAAALAHVGSRSLFPEDRLLPLGIVLLLLGGFHVLRMLILTVMLVFPVEHADRILFGFSILIMNPGALMLYIGLLALHDRRVMADLEASRKEVQTLSGLLPICCQCKKIRLESSAWQPIDVYVREHSSAEFTHGICPECMGTLYPESEFENSGEPD